MVAELFQEMTGILRQLDAEASSKTKYGNPTGLCEYGYHIGSKRNEQEWSKALRQRLSRSVLQERSQTEVPYPSGSGRCDLVLRLRDDADTWVEVKGCWPEYFNEQRCLIRNSAYDKHLRAARDDAPKVEAVLSSGAAKKVGLLLLAFDRSATSVDHDVRAIVRPRAGGWDELSDQWPDRWRTDWSVKVWFWHRSAV